METGTHFHLAKKIHALNSNRVEKKTLFFSTCVVKKKLKNDMFRAFFTIRFEIFHFLLFFFYSILKCLLQQVTHGPHYSAHLPNNR